MADLVEIWEYIASDSPGHADGFADRIDSCIQALAQQPRKGRGRAELGAGLRSFTVGRYVIFYEAVPNGVDVVRVIHGSRDIEAALKDEEE